MKNDKIVNAYNSIQLGDEAKNRVFDKVMHNQEKKRPLFKLAAPFAAVAAVICLIVFGGVFSSTQDGNLFILKAYAMEQQTDGYIELREVDLLGETHYWSTYNDGSVFYVSANLKCEGENIRSVNFYADEGFFAKQHLTIENGRIIIAEGITASYRKDPGDTGYTLIMYGDDFEIIGNSFTLYNDAITDDFLLFLGMPVSNWREQPSQIKIRAVATFNDGQTQEIVLTLDLLLEPGVGVVKIPQEEIERQRAELEVYEVVLQNIAQSIPLELCEIVSDSVQTLSYGDTFEYSFDDYSIGNVRAETIFFAITEESIDSAMNHGLFDENGIFIIGSRLSDCWNGFDGSDGYIAVIENNGDGTFTGMVYMVPRQLINEYMS